MISNELEPQVMRRQPGDANDAREQHDQAGGKAEAACSAVRQRQKCHPAQPVHAAAEPEQQEDCINSQAKRVPVQRVAPVAVADADKRPGEAAAGAGQAGQLVKQADRRQMGDPATGRGQGQQHAGGKNCGQ